MQQIKRELQSRLEEIYTPEEATSLTRLLLERVTGKSYTMLLAEWQFHFTPEQQTICEELIQRLLRHEPIQYVLGETYFADLRFEVAPGVLIPRPETEELVMWITDDWRGKAPAVLDIGTGSGCIAISVAYHLPKSKVLAWDISPDALRIATRNAELNRVDVQFELHDALSDTTDEALFDVIVSNPPYVMDSESEVMEQNVLKYEPHLALFVPDNDALRFYRAIAMLAWNGLRPGGMLYFEINQALGAETVQLVRSIGYTDVQLRCDLFGKDRMVRATR